MFDYFRLGLRLVLIRRNMYKLGLLRNAPASFLGCPDVLYLEISRSLSYLHTREFPQFLLVHGECFKPQLPACIILAAHHTRRAYEGVKLKLHLFSALDRNRLSSVPADFPPGKARTVPTE